MSKESPENTEQLKVTPITQFKKDSVSEFVKLPSGNTIRIRKPSIMRVIKYGNIPSELIQFFQENQGKQEEMNWSEMAKMLKSMDYLIMDMVVEPTVTLSGDDNSISVDDFTDEDRNFIMGYMQGGVEETKPFLSEETDTDNRPSSETIQSTT